MTERDDIARSKGVQIGTGKREAARKCHCYFVPDITLPRTKLLVTHEKSSVHSLFKMIMRQHRFSPIAGDGVICFAQGGAGCQSYDAGGGGQVAPDDVRVVVDG